MKYFLFSFILILLASSAYPQYCEIRKATRQTNKVLYHGKTLKVFSGQKAQFQVNRKIGRMKNIVLLDTMKSAIQDMKTMTSVIENHNREQNVCIDFSTIEHVAGKSLAVLLIKNPFKGRITFKAKIYSDEKKRFVKTNVLPAMPGITGILTWSEPIDSIILYKFRIHEEEKEF